MLTEKSFDTGTVKLNTVELLEANYRSAAEGKIIRIEQMEG